MIYENSQFSFIDWFKFELVFPYKKSACSTLYNRLFSLLKLNVDEYDEVAFGNNFKINKRYLGNTIVSMDPIESSKRRDGRDYLIVDMSAVSCRAFEERGGNWNELIQFLASFNDLRLCGNVILKNSELNDLPFAVDDVLPLICVMKRIDLAFDIADNPFFTLKKLKNKISSLSYICRFRALKNQDIECLKHKAHQEIFNLSRKELDCLDNLYDEGNERINVIDSKYGYSVIFGNKNNLQLNIYDKKAEVFKKTKEILPYNELIRFEMRFADNHAHTILLLLNNIDFYKQLDLFTSQKLYCIFKIKAKSYLSCSASERTNYRRITNWSPYIKMLKTLGDINLQDKYCLLAPKNVPATDPFIKSINWIDNSVFDTLSKIATVDQSDSLIMEQISKSILKSFLKGYFNIDKLDQINKVRRLNQLPDLTLKGLLELAKQKYIEFGGDEYKFKLPYEDYLKFYSKFINFDNSLFEKSISMLNLEKGA